MPKHNARWTPLPAAACQLASPAGCFMRWRVFPCTGIKFRSSDGASSQMDRWFLCQDSSRYRSSSSEAPGPAPSGLRSPCWLRPVIRFPWRNLHKLGWDSGWKGQTHPR